MLRCCHCGWRFAISWVRDASQKRWRQKRFCEASLNGGRIRSRQAFDQPQYITACSARLAGQFIGQAPHQIDAAAADAHSAGSRSGTALTSNGSPSSRMWISMRSAFWWQCTSSTASGSSRCAWRMTFVIASWTARARPSAVSSLKPGAAKSQHEIAGLCDVVQVAGQLQPPGQWFRGHSLLLTARGSNPYMVTAGPLAQQVAPFP